MLHIARRSAARSRNDATKTRADGLVDRHTIEERQNGSDDDAPTDPRKGPYATGKKSEDEQFKQMVGGQKRVLLWYLTATDKKRAWP